jgi:uncharacterized membrane-anchored protein YhcB (DUF1043 family)
MWVMALILGFVVGVILGFVGAVIADGVSTLINIKTVLKSAAKTKNTLTVDGRYFKVIDMNGLQGEDIGGDE